MRYWQNNEKQRFCLPERHFQPNLPKPLFLFLDFASTHVLTGGQKEEVRRESSLKHEFQHQILLTETLPLNVTLSFDTNLPPPLPSASCRDARLQLITHRKSVAVPLFAGSGLVPEEAQTGTGAPADWQ